MEMNDFETGFLASSRKVAHLLFWVAVSVGRTHFRTHSEQRARASRGQKALHAKIAIFGFFCHSPAFEEGATYQRSCEFQRTL